MVEVQDLLPPPLAAVWRLSGSASPQHGPHSGALLRRHRAGEADATLQSPAGPEGGGSTKDGEGAWNFRCTGVVGDGEGSGDAKVKKNCVKCIFPAWKICVSSYALKSIKAWSFPELVAATNCWKEFIGEVD